MVGYFCYFNKFFNLIEFVCFFWSSKLINFKIKMKNFVLIFLSCIFFIIMFIVQVDCEFYFFIEEGISWEFMYYLVKGKVLGVMQYELFEKIVDGDDMIFKVKVIIFDKNEEEVYIFDFEVFCKVGEFSYDMIFMMDGVVMEVYSEMDVEVDGGEFFLLDLDVFVGIIFFDGYLDICVGVGGGININMVIDIIDCKIEGCEEIIIFVGIFNCVVLS